MKGKNMATIRSAENYAVTRKQKRYIARQEMKRAGKKNFCKHGYETVKLGLFTSYTRTLSYFAEHWKEYAEYKEDR